jgi:hypothetical protein
MQMTVFRLFNPLFVFVPHHSFLVPRWRRTPHDTRPKEKKKSNPHDQLDKEVMEPQPVISRLKRVRLGDDTDIAWWPCPEWTPGGRGCGGGRRAKKRGHSLNQQQADAPRKVATTKLLNDLPPSVVEGLGGWTDLIIETLPPSKLQKNHRVVVSNLRTWYYWQCTPGLVQTSHIGLCDLFPFKSFYGPSY